MHDPKAIESFIKLLNDPDVQVRSTAAMALGESGDPKATEVLLKRILNRKDVFGGGSYPIHVAGSWRFQDNQLVPDLVASLAALRKEIAAAADSQEKASLTQWLNRTVNVLALFEAAQATEAVADLLNDPNVLADDETFEAVTSALVRLNAKSAAPALLALLVDEDQRWPVRTAAADALGGLGAGSAVEPMRVLFTDTVQRLKADGRSVDWPSSGDSWLFGSPDPSDQDPLEVFPVTLVRAMAATKAPQGAEFLVELLNGRNQDARDLAARLLAYRFTDPRAIDYLRLCARDDCDWALSALAVYDDPAAALPLLRALGTGMANSVWVALYDHPQAKVRYLLAVQGSKSLAVRRQAAMLLSAVAGPADVDDLVRALGHEDSFVRANAARALRPLADRRAAAALIAALKDPHWSVRTEAALALAEMVDGRAVRPLIGALGDGNYRVRAASANALGPLGDRRAVDTLMAALGDTHPGVRLQAAWALGQIGDPQALTALARTAVETPPLADLAGPAIVLTSPGTVYSSAGTSPEDPRPVAGAAIQLIHSDDTFATLIEKLDDPSDAVGELAAEALGRSGNRRAVRPLIVAYGLRRAWYECDEGLETAATRALERLTGQEFYLSVDGYRWWAQDKMQE
ncbi:MAG: HEAT repeat domain-containing protein [Planctomycetes bacterium]|nr:HEAT repeat domain-containing protein [Planctomycetota bacterium]